MLEQERFAKSLDTIHEGKSTHCEMAHSPDGGGLCGGVPFLYSVISFSLDSAEIALHN